MHFAPNPCKGTFLDEALHICLARFAHSGSRCLLLPSGVCLMLATLPCRFTRDGPEGGIAAWSASVKPSIDS